MRSQVNCTEKKRGRFGRYVVASSIVAQEQILGKTVNYLVSVDAVASIAGKACCHTQRPVRCTSLGACSPLFLWI